MTTATPWYDEFAFLKFNKNIFDSAAFAYSAASEAAEKNGTPHFRLITTTPNKMNLPEAKYCFSLITDACNFDEAWYDKDINIVKDIISHNSGNDFVFIQFSYEELGKDEKWLQKQKKLVNNDLQTIKREIFLEWALSDDNSVFDEETLENLKNFVRPPLYSFYIDETYKFDVFANINGMNRRNFAISIDVAGALEKDSTVITVIDPFTYETLIQFKSNKISVADTCKLLNELIQTYFPASVLIPERNNMGIALIQDLLKTPVAKNLYYEIKERVVEEEVEDSNYKIGKMGSHGKNKKKKKEKRIYGLDTTPKSREKMYKEILNMVVTDNPHLVNNNNLYNEIKTLTRDKKGKIQADIGFHDDVVMSYLIGMYALLYGNTRNKFFKVVLKEKLVEDVINKVSNRKIVRNVSNMRNILNNSSGFKYMSEEIYNSASKELRNKSNDTINEEYNKKVKRNYSRLKSLF